MSNFVNAEVTWKNFLNNKILDYGSKRNYDYGPDKDSSVSKISPYVSHRVLIEFELIKEVLAKYNTPQINKFIEELYWRLYWKGWLEFSPCVWDRFKSTKNQDFDYEDYKKAISGETNLSFFNSWINELVENNYLHNHTRMWFASTWIFQLGLPWELGARLFFKHLFDGDAASNLLSWRWVAGLHTKGKKYFFTAENLEKFSNRRYKTDSIENKNINLEDNFDVVLSEEIFSSDMNQKSQDLLLFENDLNVKTLKNISDRYQNIYLILLDNEDREIKLSQKVLNFKRNLVLEFINIFPKIKFISSYDFRARFNDINKFDLIYPCIGDNYDFIKRFQLNYKTNIYNLVREADLYCWQFAKKGFYKFNGNIPEINKLIQNIDL